MNLIEKLLVVMFLVLIVGMLIYPPWVFTVAGSAKHAGYSFILTPPKPTPPTPGFDGVTLDARLLILQFAGVFLMILSLYLVLDPLANYFANSKRGVDNAESDSGM
jgi:hypothetical protein